MKYLLICFFVFCAFVANAQNLYIKPSLGSQHGFSYMKDEHKRFLSSHTITNENVPSYWTTNLYAGLALEWQKNTKQRWELNFAMHQVGYSYRFDISYYDPQNDVVLRDVSQVYQANAAMNVSLSYAHKLKEIHFSSNRRLSIEGIMGIGYLRVSRKGVYIPGGFHSSLAQINFQSRSVAKNYNGAGINLALATRIFSVKGNPMLDIRLQYVQGLRQLAKEGYDYTLKGTTYYSESVSNGSAISISLGVPIRIFNLNKNKKQD